MTDEGQDRTERWVERNEAKYAYAYDPKKRFKEFFDVRGIPHAVLIDPGGKIVWRGHPGGLHESMISDHLDGAIRFPYYLWPFSGNVAAKALKKGSLAAALKAAAKVSDETSRARIIATIRDRIDHEMLRMKSAKERGDYLSAHNCAKALSKDLASFPEGVLAKSILAELKGDDEARRILSVQEDIVDVLGKKYRSRRQVDKSISKLEKLHGKYLDTYVELQSREAIARLKDIRRKLK